MHSFLRDDTHSLCWHFCRRERVKRAKKSEAKKSDAKKVEEAKKEMESKKEDGDAIEETKLEVVDAIASASLTPPKRPDLKELSKDLPAGWQVITQAQIPSNFSLVQVSLIYSCLCQSFLEFGVSQCLPLFLVFLLVVN